MMDTLEQFIPCFKVKIFVTLIITGYKYSRGGSNDKF